MQKRDRSTLGLGLDQLANDLTEYRPRVIGISCGGMVSYRNTLQIAAFCKDNCPDSLIVVGGSHAGPLGATVLKDSLVVDCVVTGEGGLPLLAICQAVANSTTLYDIPDLLVRSSSAGAIHDTGTDNRVVPLDQLVYNYSLWPDAESVVPVVEASRGCPWRCAYCTNEPMFGGYRAKSVQVLVDEIAQVVAQRHRSDRNLVLLAMTFGAQAQWLSDFVSCLEHRRLDIEWKTECRVDGPWPRYLSRLVSVGLRGLDPKQANDDW